MCSNRRHTSAQDREPRSSTRHNRQQKTTQNPIPPFSSALVSLHLSVESEERLLRRVRISVERDSLVLERRQQVPETLVERVVTAFGSFVSFVEAAPTTAQKPEKKKQGKNHGNKKNERGGREGLVLLVGVSDAWLVLCCDGVCVRVSCT